MRVREAASAAGVALRSDPADAGEPCLHVWAGGPLDGVAFMVEDGRISRIEVTAGPHRTASGVGIGSTERELRERHPSIVETPGFYDPASGTCAS